MLAIFPAFKIHDTVSVISLGFHYLAVAFALLFYIAFFYFEIL